MSFVCNVLFSVRNCSPCIWQISRTNLTLRLIIRWFAFGPSQHLVVGTILVVSIQHTVSPMIRKRCFNRGAAFSSIFAALASAPSIVSAHDFTGNYDDPNHPNCLRKIAMFSGDTANVFGTDGNPGCPPDGSGEKWHLVGKVDGDSILVNFSPKGVHVYSIRKHTVVTYIT